MSNTVENIEVMVYHELKHVEDIWHSMEKNGICTVFQSYSWMQAWMQTQGDSSELLVVLVLNSDKQPLMLLPMCIQRDWQGSTLVSAGGPLADYNAPLLGESFHQQVGKGEFTKIWKKIKNALPSIDRIAIERMPDTIENSYNPLLDLNLLPHPSSAHSTKVYGPLEQFILDKRSRRWASGERRKERRLAEHGKITFRMASNDDNYNELLDTCLNQKSSGYRRLGVEDLFADSRQVEFVKLLTQANANTNMVVLCGVEVADSLAATFWGLNYRQRLYYMLPAYEENDLQTYSPGNILMRNLFDWSAQNGINVFDFTVGDEPYKFQWSDDRMELYDYFEGLTLRGKLTVTITALKQKLKKSVKANERLSALYRNLRSKYN